MGYVLLWSESLALPLLLVATVVAFVPQMKRQPVSGIARVSLRAVAILVALVPLVVFAGLTAIVPCLYFAHLVPSTLFSSLVALTIAYAIGAAAMLFLGLRHRRGETMAVAAKWPRYKLAIACFAVGAGGALTIGSLDQAAKQQAATLGNEASCLALAAAPARIPDRENAAILYQQAIEAIRPWPEPEMPQGGMGMPAMGGMGMPGAPPPPPTCQEKWTQWKATGKLGFDVNDLELRRFLKQQEPALALLREGAGKPGCFFDRNYARTGMDMEFPESWPLRRGVDILRAGRHLQSGQRRLPRGDSRTSRPCF